MSDMQERRYRRYGRAPFIVVPFLIISALAIGLGVGLGVPSRSSRVHNGVWPASTVDQSQQVLDTMWNVNAPAQIREFNFTISLRRGSPGGVEKDVLTVNGISPGPLIEANLGDQIVVHVNNTLNTSTSIHWHGQYQNGTNRMDGTFGVTECGIPPMQSFTYNWTAQNFGTYWWHAHRGMQYSDGLYGPLILHSPAAPSYNVSGDYILMAADSYEKPAMSYLPDYKSSSGPPGGKTGDEPVPDCGLINGLGLCPGGEKVALKTNISGFEQGKQYRFRLMNAASLSMIRFELEGHQMTIIEADGTPVEPRKVDFITVKAAQRYSVLISMNREPDAYKFRADLTMDMFMYDNPALIANQSATLYYDGVSLNTSTTKLVQRNSSESVSETDLRPLFPRIAPASTKQDTLVVGFTGGRDGSYRSIVNGSTWVPSDSRATLYETLRNETRNAGLASQLILTNNAIEVWDLILKNNDTMEHPMVSISYS